MKRLLLLLSALLFLLLLCPQLLIAQNGQGLQFHKRVEGRVVADRDQNEACERLTDYEFNFSKRAYTVSGRFVKNPIGLDLYKLGKPVALKRPFDVLAIGERGDSLHVSAQSLDTIDVNGCRCINVVDIPSSENLDLVSLADIRQEFYPEVEGKCLYMVNKFFIMNHADLYKLDRGFVYRVEKVRSEDIDVLKDYPSFTIIRVFTRTEHNRFPEYFGD